MRDDWGIVGGIVFVVMFLPAIGSAQMIQGIPRSPMAPTVMSGGKVPEDVYIMPWIATGVVYDDNVFFARQGRKQEDVFLRVTPGLQASYQSTPFTIVGDYRFDSEVYSKLDQLSTAQQRQFGTVDTRWRPSTSWTVGTTVGYAQTNTPFELNILTSAQTARFRTERYFVNPTAEYRIDQSTKLIGQYAFAKDMFRGVEINSNIINASLEHRFGPHDTLGPAYVGRYFTFDVDPMDPLDFSVIPLRSSHMPCSCLGDTNFHRIPGWKYGPVPALPGGNWTILRRLLCASVSAFPMEKSGCHILVPSRRLWVRSAAHKPTVFRSVPGRSCSSISQ